MKTNVRFKVLSANQVVLFPSNIGDKISKDCPVWIVNEVADA